VAAAATAAEAAPAAADQRQSLRSQQWQEMKRWNEPGYPRQGAAMRDNRDAGSRGAAADRAAVTTKARPSTLGSTAAGITAAITAEGAAMTAGTTKLLLS
jgi:hypothetical protein